jgi:hypothetical protein
VRVRPLTSQTRVCWNSDLGEGEGGGDRGEDGGGTRVVQAVRSGAVTAPDGGLLPAMVAAP